jgi:thiol:disulfide interchange protein DsbC
MQLRLALALALALFPLAAPRAETPAAAPEPPVPAAVQQTLARLIPGGAPTSVRPAAVAGLYEVVVGPEVVYLSADGRYLIQGDLIEVESRSNLTEATRNAARLSALEAVGEETMAVFGPKDAKHTVTVFTDVECPYCVKLHQEVPELNRQGVRVRYLAFPRNGLTSPGYRKTVSVWCAEDRQQALTDAKAGKPVPEKTCDNPVADHFELGQALGVNGTPTLILEDGRLIPGYVPAARLVRALDGGGLHPGKPGG